MRLVLALLFYLSFVSLVSATLQNSFCTGLSNTTISGWIPQPNVNAYTLSNVCLNFYNGTSFGLALNGFVNVKGTWLSVSATTCIGEYFFAQGQKIAFSENLAKSVCLTSTGAAYSFCWACPKFAGTYIPFFDSIDTPKHLSITPDASQPQPYLWGGLPYSMDLICNTTTCGSASGLIPPSPLPSVRRIVH
jgi:hypothetical protein